MTNEISIFNFKSTPVRTSIQDGEVWFCLVDVCDSLNLKRGSRVIDRLSEAGVRKTYVSYPSGKKEAIFINESNLYKLIFKSNKPAAVQFGDWVTGEVLPTIRKTGSYKMKNDAIISVDIIRESIQNSIKNLLKPYSGEDKYFNVSDGDMVQYMQRWYWTRHRVILKALDDKDARIRELEAKLRMVKQAIN